MRYINLHLHTYLQWKNSRWPLLCYIYEVCTANYRWSLCEWQCTVHDVTSELVDDVFSYEMMMTTTTTTMMMMMMHFFVNDNLALATCQTHTLTFWALFIYKTQVIYFLFILYMKPTHKTVYTMDIKRHNVCCWLIGNCRDKPLMQRRR